MEKDFKSIILLLTTQAMINLGEINDPLSSDKKKDKNNADLFISLLIELQKKTSGNLTEAEENFLDEVLKNLKQIYKNKFSEEILK